jgi:hypothetical protein
VDEATPSQELVPGGGLSRCEIYCQHLELSHLGQDLHRAHQHNHALPAVRSNCPPLLRAPHPVHRTMHCF